MKRIIIVCLGFIISSLSLVLGQSCMLVLVFNGLRTKVGGNVKMT